MGAYNTIRVPWRDPATQEQYELSVQFKYGDTWQHEYRLGDELKWGGNDVGRRNVRKVVVDGALENSDALPGCPADFEVYIVNNRITDVRLATGRYNFVGLSDPYLVLEE